MKEKSELFAARALLIEYNSQKYDKAYRDNPNDVYFEGGFPFKEKSDSILINTLFYEIDKFLNFKGVIPLYNPDYEYKKGAFFLLNGRIYAAMTDIEPHNLSAATILDVRNAINKFPKNPSKPYFSLQSLIAAIDNDKTRVLLKKGKDNSYINNKFISEQIPYQCIDYQDSLEVFPQDNYRIHFYSEKFLQREEPQEEAFYFNFFKKLIFLNTSEQRFILIKNNIFKSFPENALIKICRGENDYKEEFNQAKELALEFVNKTYLFHQKMEIQQISSNKFVITHLIGDGLLETVETYLDIFNKKLIKFKDETEIVDISNNKDYQAALDLLSVSKTPYTCLYLDKESYILFSTDNQTMSVIRYNMFGKLEVVKNNIAIDADFVRSDNILKIQRNRGQFPKNKHLIICEMKKLPNNVFDYIYNQKYLTFDISKESKIEFNNDISEELADKYYCQFSSFDSETGELTLYKFDNIYADGNGPKNHITQYDGSATYLTIVLTRIFLSLNKKSYFFHGNGNIVECAISIIKLGLSTVFWALGKSPVENTKRPDYFWNTKMMVCGNTLATPNFQLTLQKKNDTLVSSTDTTFTVKRDDPFWMSKYLYDASNNNYIQWIQPLWFNNRIYTNEYGLPFAYRGFNLSNMHFKGQPYNPQNGLVCVFYSRIPNDIYYSRERIESCGLRNENSISTKEIQITDWKIYRDGNVVYETAQKAKITDPQKVLALWLPDSKDKFI